MSRYIDADALKETIDREIFRHDTIDHVFQIIDDAPTIEPKTKVVAQVTFDEEKLREIVKEAVERFKEEYEIADRPQGEWMDAKNAGWKCTVCGKWSNGQYDYCPNCGADMRKGASDGNIS